MRKTWIAGVAVAIAAPALAPTAALWTPAGMNPPPDRPEATPASGEIGLPPMSPWLLPARASAPRGEPLALCDCAMDRADARPAPVHIGLPPPADAARRGAPAPLPPPVGWHGGGHGGDGGPAPVPVVPVPEPSAWLMMIAGLGLVGLALRRRRAIA